jgi:hypothetical protein
VGNQFQWDDLFAAINVVISFMTIIISAAIAWGVVKTNQARLSKEVEDLAEKVETHSKEARIVCEGYRDKCHDRLCEKLEKMERMVEDIKGNIDSRWSQLAIQVGVLVEGFRDTTEKANRRMFDKDGR